MRVRAVTGELSYLAPESTVLRRFTAPGESVNTGTYRTYQMPIRDGRPVRDQFTIDRNGFAIIGHTSAVTDFANREEVNEVYVGEVAEFVKFYTGADRVATLGWVLRRSAAPTENASQPQAALVHDDYSVAGARGRAEADYASRYPAGPGFRRALITSLWRVFSPPPQDWPLALCDYQSVEPGEGLDNRLYFVDKIPDDLYADMPADAPGTSGFEFHHNPRPPVVVLPGHDPRRDPFLQAQRQRSRASLARSAQRLPRRDRASDPTPPQHRIPHHRLLRIARGMARMRRRRR